MHQHRGARQGRSGMNMDPAKHRRFPPKHLSVKIKKAIGINDADVAELVDARDLKSLDGNVVRVRVPPPAPEETRV